MVTIQGKGSKTSVISRELKELPETCRCQTDQILEGFSPKMLTITEKAKNHRKCQKSPKISKTTKNAKKSQKMQKNTRKMPKITENSKNHRSPEAQGAPTM